MIKRMRRSRPYTGQIPCEFCPRIIRGGNKAGLFANYNRHVLSAHPVGEPYYLGEHR